MIASCEFYEVCEERKHCDGNGRIHGKRANNRGSKSNCASYAPRKSKPIENQVYVIGGNNESNSY